MTTSVQKPTTAEAAIARARTVLADLSSKAIITKVKAAEYNLQIAEIEELLAKSRKNGGSQTASFSASTTRDAIDAALALWQGLADQGMHGAEIDLLIPLARLLVAG